MKQIILAPSTYILRFDKGEELFLELLQFCSANAIHSAYFTAIGATQEVLLAYYDLPTKTYEDHTVQENMEIVSITGNIAQFNGQPVIHAHGVFSKRDLSTIGGHIKKLVVSATCEVVLHKLEQTLEREKNDEVGLNLLK